MAIRFFCPLGHRLKVPDERAGKKGRCPICHQRLVVPEMSTVEESSAATADFPEAKLECVEDVPGDDSRATSVECGPMDNEAPITSEVVPSAAQSMPSQLAVPPETPLVVVTMVSPPPLPTVPRGEVVPDAPSVSRSLRRVHWAAWARGDAQESFAISRPTPRQLEVVYWLACLLPFAAVFSAAPAMPHMRFAGAPVWAQALLSVACLKFAYAAWLAMVPDWSTVRVGMYLLGAVAAFDVLAAITLPFLPERPLALLGLAGMAATAAAWCVLSAAIGGAASIACRLIAERWRAGKL